MVQLNEKNEYCLIDRIATHACLTGRIYESYRDHDMPVYLVTIMPISRLGIKSGNICSKA